MKSLVNCPPNDQFHTEKGITFYYGPVGRAITSLPSGSEFSLVSKDAGESGWYYARYRVTETENEFATLESRYLEPDEVAYFNQLAAQMSAPLKASAVAQR